MADQQGGDARVTNLTPEDVARGLTEGRMLLVDVREPNEVAIERYPDAVVVPLSSFDPAAIPDPQGREVVFACRSGRRSVTASLAAQERGYPYAAHLAGGILAWKTPSRMTAPSRTRPPSVFTKVTAPVVTGRPSNVTVPVTEP